MEFYSKTKTFRGRNHHFGYREQPRNVEKILKKNPRNGPTTIMRLKYWRNEERSKRDSTFVGKDESKHGTTFKTSARV